MPLCPVCQEENSERARFCQACGAKLAEPETAERFRKVVSILFSDVVGSTALGEALDPETLSHVMTEYFEAMKPVVERHGGTVAKFIGDALMGVFGLPVLHEDDALRSVRTAVEMRERLGELNDELSRRWGVTIATRTGISTGAVAGLGLARDQNFVAGDTANTAARLQQHASPGEILVAAATYQLVDGAVDAELLPPLELRNRTAPVTVYRILRALAEGEETIRHPETPLVGRAGEMALLEAALADAIKERACRLVALLGPPGVGKSRLVVEFLDRTGASVRVIQGKCLPYGEGITYWPLAQALRQAGGIAERDAPEAARAKLDALAGGAPEAAVIAERVAQVMGLSGGRGSPQEIPWAVTKLLEHLAADQPLVLVLDDLQWAEPTLLDLVQHVGEHAAGVPILLLGLARPEFGEERAGWAETIVLSPLSTAESGRLIASLLEGAGLPSAIGDRIVRTSGGNPLFLEQLLSMLVDQGLLQRRPDGWTATADLSSLTIPPTIHALLSARLETLGSEEQQVLGRASVIGEVFYRGALEVLVPEPLRGRIDDSLDSLVRKDLVRPEHSDLGDEDAFAFSHLLIRDAAYEGLTKEDRASFHQRFADWLEGVAGDRLDEVDEIVGYHLEQSWRYRSELGPVGKEGEAVAARASAHLGNAGLRAFGRDEMSATINLLDRATALMDGDTPRRAELLLVLSEALRHHGELERARQAHQAAAGLADRLGEARIRGRVMLGRAGILFSSDTDRWLAEGGELLDRAEALLEPSGDQSGLATVCRFRGYLAMEAGRAGDAAVHYRAGVEHARAVADPRETGNCLGNELLAIAWGLTPVEEALARCEEEEGQGAGPHLIGQIGLPKMPLQAVLGDFEGARTTAGRTRSALEDVGRRATVAGIFSLTLATVERLAGDLSAAERLLRRSCEALEEMQDSNLAAALASLGHVLALQGRAEEALAVLDRAEPMIGTAPLDRASVSGARALALSVSQRDEAVRLAGETAAALWDSEMLIDAADWLLTSAEALHRAGEVDEATRVAARALDMCGRKGNRVMAAQARRIVALAGAMTPGVDG